VSSRRGESGESGSPRSALPAASTSAADSEGER